jgi:predicted RNA-binding Zn ribbon-like protein
MTCMSTSRSEGQGRRIKRRQTLVNDRCGGLGKGGVRYIGAWRVTSQLEYDRYVDPTVTVAVELVNRLTPGWMRGVASGLPSRPEERLIFAQQAIGQIDSLGDRALVADPPQAEEVFRLAALLRPVFESARDRDSAAEHTQGLLRLYGAAPQLVREPDGIWRLHFHSAYAGLAAAMGAGCATAFAWLIEASELDRLGECDAPRCDRVYYDVSRNGRRRYCSLSCSNRIKSESFRNRQRLAAEMTADGRQP